MLQSTDTASQTKERPRAILGRLQVSAPPPAKYIPEYDGQSVFLKHLFQLWRVVSQWGLFAASRKQDKS